MDYHFYFFAIYYFQERKINALDDSCFFGEDFDKIKCPSCSY
jgi:hypothetical protein